jgi:hypothetical protein
MTLRVSARPAAGLVRPEIMISEAKDLAVPGQLGRRPDPCGLDSSAIGMLDQLGDLDTVDLL